MATTGPKLTIPFTINTDKIVGQGEKPEVWVLYSTSDAGDHLPTWTGLTDIQVRSWEVNRGRESELSQVDAGTATITVDNRDRLFDPTSNTIIRPMNRWWIRSQFSGITEDLFKGYAESYDQQFPDWGGSDAVTVVSCVDEMKVLARDALPTTDPPRDSYRDLVMADQPSGYWPMDDGLNPEGHLTFTKAAAVGQPLKAVNGDSSLFVGAIVGESTTGYHAAQTSSTVFFRTDPLEVGQSGDMGGLSEFTVEVWVKLNSALPAATEVLIYGPQSNSTHTYQMTVTTAGAFGVHAKNSGGTDHLVLSTTTASLDVWYHVVGTIDAGSLRIYVNGTQEASTAFTGSFGTLDANVSLMVGNTGVDIGTRTRGFDELATYRYGMSAARVSAHFTAGRDRGFEQHYGETRIHKVLEAVGSTTPKNITLAYRELLPARMRGQSPLDELRAVEAADAIDAVLFIAKDGTITFLSATHRLSSPWNTVQATFDDDGTDLPYLDLDLDYSDSFIANEWNVTREGGLTQTLRDATSVNRFGKRPVSVTGVQVTSEFDAAQIAVDMLAKYKDPMTRITALELDTSLPAVTAAALGLEIGDRIRVIRTHPAGQPRDTGAYGEGGYGGGPFGNNPAPNPIDQTLFVQKISVSADNSQAPWRIRLGVSPL